MDKRELVVSFHHVGAKDCGGEALLPSEPSPWPRSPSFLKGKEDGMECFECGLVMGAFRHI